MATKTPVKLQQSSSTIQRLIDDARRVVNYIVTDFSIEIIASKYKENAEAEGDIFVPDYQRSLVWSESQMSYFIESLLLRIPVPPLFLYDVDGRLEIVDGSQRVRCISAYIGNKFALSDLEKLDFLNGYQFANLPKTASLRLLNSPIRTFVLSEQADQSTRVELFRRLNTSGKILTDAEIRVGAFPGRLLDIIKECALSAKFTELCPAKRGQRAAESERQELVLRFFAYLEGYTRFEHDVRDFLDKYLEKGNQRPKSDLNPLVKSFNKMVEFVAKHYPYGFRRSAKSSQTPRVRFEAISVGTALALASGKSPKVSLIQSWLEGDEFKDLTRIGATNSAKLLRLRIEYVRDKLIG